MTLNYIGYTEIRAAISSEIITDENNNALMTETNLPIITENITVFANQPLTHARILYAPITGTITAGGTNGALAANDFTFQRWTPGALPKNWTLVTAANAKVDTVFIAAHNLGTTGSTVNVQTSPTPTGPFTTRATIIPKDDSAIAVMFNDNGVPYDIRGIRIAVSGSSSAVQVGIIRAGVALQMQQPVFGGVLPIGLNRIVETRHSMSETGQWLGRTIQRQARRTTMEWSHLKASWYRSTFEPFSLTLPQTPFGLIQNPARMPESVAWCWTDQTPEPSNMGLKDYMQVSLAITGYLE